MQVLGKITDRLEIFLKSDGRFLYALQEVVNNFIF